MSVYFYGCITMDGYLADIHHNLDWLYQTGTTEETDYESFYRSMDITIMGKRTFHEIENMMSEACPYPTTENYVFTHAKSLSMKGFIPMSGDIVDFIQKINKEKNIWVIGGNSFVFPEGRLKEISPKRSKKYGQFAELVYTKS